MAADRQSMRLKTGNVAGLASFLTALALLAIASLVLVSATAAGPVASKQPVVMETKQKIGPEGGTFVVTPQGSGPLKSDSGKFTFTVSRKDVVRSSQSVLIFTGTTHWAGKLGTMVLRERTDDVAAGSGYRVGTGVWSIWSAKGTGQYAGLTGSGRAAYVVTQHRVFGRWEGSVTRR